MFKKIFFSFQASFIAAVLSLIIVLITAKHLGAYGRGAISMFAFYVSLVQLANELLGSAAVFFLLKKYQVNEILLISYIWFLVSSVTCTFTVSVLGLIGNDLLYVFFYTCLFSSVYLLNQRIIINRISTFWYNLLTVLQPVIIFLLILITGFSSFTIKDFLIFQVISYSVTNFISLIILNRELIAFRPRFNILRELIKESVKLGLTNQITNLTQILNYRIFYFYIERFQSLQAVGIYNIVLSFANVIWLFSVATGIHLGNQTSKLYELNKNAINQLKKYMKISVTFTLCAILIVYLLPSEVYIYALDKDFSEVKELILWSAPGIIIFTIAKILGYFFSSLGKLKINFYSSFSGLFPSAIMGYIFVKQFKIYGAVLSCSLSLITSTLVLLYFFWKESRKIKQTI